LAEAQSVVTDVTVSDDSQTTVLLLSTRWRIIWFINSWSIGQMIIRLLNA